MTKESTSAVEHKIAVMTAYANGEPIQEMRYGSVYGWRNCNGEPFWNWEYCDYRVAPKPSYRPFTNKEEFIQFLKTHSAMPYVLLNGEYRIVSQIYDEGITIAESNYTYEGLVKKNIKFLDGTVCGIHV